MIGKLKVGEIKKNNKKTKINNKRQNYYIGGMKITFAKLTTVVSITLC